MSALLSDPSRVSCLVSRVSCLGASCLMSACLVSACPRVSCFVFRVSCLVSRVSCLVSRVSCHVSRASCLVPCVSCFVSLNMFPLFLQLLAFLLQQNYLDVRCSCCSCSSGKCHSLKTLLHCFLIYSSYDILICFFKICLFLNYS